jgi:hypothetical protein
LDVRLDAVAAVVLDGLSYRRARRMVRISKTEVGDSLDLLLGPLADLGFCQPDGTFVATVDDLRQWLGEMAASGEAVLVDGLATRVQRPRGWTNQKVLDDAEVASPLDRGFRGLAKGREHRHAPIAIAAPGIASPTPSGRSTACRRGCALVEQAIAHLANPWALRRWLHRVST